MDIKTIRELVEYIGIFGAKIATRMKDETGHYKDFAYDDYKKNARYIAAYFDRVKKLKKGEKVAIYSENRPEWLMAYFGIVYNGLWAVPLDARLTDLEVKNLLLDSDTKIIFISRNLYENISGEPEITKHVSEFIFFDEVEEEHRGKKIKSFQEILDVGKRYFSKAELSREISEDDVASLIYTSGTTGSPKGVLLTHGNFAHQFNNIHKSLVIGPEDVLLSLLPLHHTFEFSVELTILFLGCSITYAESFKPNKMLANIKETNVTIMVGVPLIFEKIYEGIMRQIRGLPIGIKHIMMGLYYLTSGLNKITNNKAGKMLFRFLRKKAGLNSLRFVISGAAPLSFNVARGFETLGITILNGYGLTEASPVVSVNPLLGKIKNQSVGLPIAGVEIKIDEPDELGNGEIMIHGQNVMKGYYKNPKATAEVINSEGWLYTGDIGRIDPDGYLHITGRKKNIIVTPGGKNVYPEEIEEMLNSSPFVLESLVLGVPDPEGAGGENIYAFIVPNYEFFDTYGSINSIKITEDFMEKVISKHVREVSSKLVEYKRIKGWRIYREEFQKTSTKKIKRYLFSGKDFLNI